MERVAVYGLLRRGERLAHLMAAARYVGHARIAGFDLHDLGPYPAALPGGGSIETEIYELASLHALDAAEGVHEDPPLYRRVAVHALGASAWLYVYARDPQGAPRIESGDWLAR